MDYVPDVWRPLLLSFSRSVLPCLTASDILVGFGNELLATFVNSEKKQDARLFFSKELSISYFSFNRRV